MKGLLVAGTASGVGKTTVALAIMAGLRRRGKTVQPFKCGPDFLDTGHYTRVCGRAARNLDTWMLSADTNRNILREAARDADMVVAEGMMGLFDGKSGDAETGSSAEISKLLAETHLDLGALLMLECGLESAVGGRAVRAEAGEKLRVGVAYDQAFSFYYEDNFDLLRKNGAEIVRFSPVSDPCLPNDLDALYLGGYPELYAEQLSRNGQMLDEVRAFAASGRPVYAECGGMLYLSRGLTTIDGRIYPMTGVLPLSTEMTGGLVQFGYVTVEFTEDCLLGRKGALVRGHSFHYSRVASKPKIETSYRVQYSLSGKEELEEFHQGKVLASYVHLHFQANPTVAEHFVSSVRTVKSSRMVTA